MQKRKFVVADFDFDAINDEFTSEEKDLFMSNPNKFFKKNFLKFRNSGSARSKSGGLGYNGGNSFADKNKNDGTINYQQQKE